MHRLERLSLTRAAGVASNEAPLLRTSDPVFRPCSSTNDQVSPELVPGTCAGVIRHQVVKPRPDLSWHSNTRRPCNPTVTGPHGAERPSPATQGEREGKEEAAALVAVCRGVLDGPRNAWARIDNGGGAQAPDEERARIGSGVRRGQSAPGRSSGERRSGGRGGKKEAAERPDPAASSRSNEGPPDTKRHPRRTACGATIQCTRLRTFAAPAPAKKPTAARAHEDM